MRYASVFPTSVSDLVIYFETRDMTAPWLATAIDHKVIAEMRMSLRAPLLWNPKRRLLDSKLGFRGVSSSTIPERHS
jgi:hypothetical protein